MKEKVLIIDIGNTAIELAIFENDKITKFIGFFNLETEISKLEKALKKCQIEKNIPEKGMIFSVVPKINNKIAKLIFKYFHFKISIFDWEKYDLKKKDPKITEPIGADLIADIKSGEQIGGPCIIADCGTITKLLFLDDNSNFIGLSLIPGIEVLSKLFKTNTALLPETNNIENLKSKFGLNTVESMQHGILFSTVSYIKNAFEDFDFKNKKLIITGGNLKFIKDEFKNAIIDQDFTLKGMNILFNEVAK